MCNGILLRALNILIFQQLLSGVRIEATVNEISRNVNPGTIARRVQSYVEEQNRYNSNMPRISDARLFQFSQSYSISMTRIEDTISDSDLYKAVLRRELGKIGKLLGRLTSKWHADPPAEICQPFPPSRTTANLHLPPVSDTAAHQSLVIGVFQLQSQIESGSIFEICNLIEFLCFDLFHSGIMEDALTVALWDVDFAKKIISASPIDDSSAWTHLTHALTNASIYYSSIGDRDKAYAYSQEAVKIIQEKLDSAQSLHVQLLLARNLRTQEENKSLQMLTGGSELASRATVTMETFLGPQAEQLSAEILSLLSSVDLNSVDWSAVEAEANHAAKFILFPHCKCNICMQSFLYNYSRILIELSYIQRAQGCIIEAHTTTKHALTVLQHLLLGHPDSVKFLEHTARVAFNLCGSYLQELNSLAENLAFAKECTSKYRKLLQTNFSAYVIRLLYSLQQYARNLLSAGMISESERVFMEMTALSELASQRCQDLKLPSESDGDCQFHLASIFYDEGRFSEGIHAAHNALEQFRALEFLDPDRSPLKSIKAVTKLCQLYGKTDQHQSVLLEGFKALKLIDKAVETDKEMRRFTVSGNYISLIDSIMKGLAALPPDSGSVKKASAVITRFKTLFVSQDKFNFWSDTPDAYMEVLDKNGLADNAIIYGQDFLSAWEKKHIYSSSDNTAYSYLICLMKLITLLEQQGRINEALDYSRNMTMVAPLSRHHRSSRIHALQCNLTTTHIGLLYAAGLGAVALTFAKEVSITSCSGSDDPSKGTHNDCVLNQLLNLADMQLLNYFPLEAIETAKQAESLARFEFSRSRTDSLYSFTMLKDSMYILIHALFDVGQTSESLAHSMRVKDLVNSRDCPSWKSTIDEDHNHISANIARILFVQGDYSQANQLMLQVLKLDRQLFYKEKSHFTHLALDFLFAAIASCCINEHQHGVSLLAQLEYLEQNVSITHPVLYRDVQFDLEMHAERGKWKLIQTAARAKLTCNHVDRALDLRMVCFDSGMR